MSYYDQISSADKDQLNTQKAEDYKKHVISKLREQGKDELADKLATGELTPADAINCYGGNND